jgi:hypothetical protein
MKKAVIKVVVMIAFVVVLGIIAIGLTHNQCYSGNCCATKRCSAGWHCCPTANGGCGCFLDAQGPCP